MKRMKIRLALPTEIQYYIVHSNTRLYGGTYV